MTSSTRLRGPSELIAVLPYQLGYHPSRSLLVVAFDGARMGLVQRIDLPAAVDLSPAADALLRPLRREPPDGVVLIGYEDLPGLSLPLLEATAHACAGDGIEVRDRIVVRDGRWFALDCAEQCCPAEGTPVPEPADLPAVAEFVGREISPLPSRDDLERSVALRYPSQGRRVGRLAAALTAARGRADRPDERTGEPHQEPGWQRQDLAAWAFLLRHDDDAPPLATADAVCARLAVSLADVDLRDAMVSWLCPRSLPEELVEPGLRAALEAALPARRWDVRGVRDAAVGAGPGTDDSQGGVAAQRVERRLVDLCATLEDEWAVAPLTVLAAFAWWRGDGTLSRVALERALAADPAYRLALLLEQMVDLAIRPDRSPGDD